MIDIFSDATKNFSKNMLMIHFQKPDLISRACTLSFAKMYTDWNFVFLTEDVLSWNKMFKENGFLNVNVVDCRERSHAS